jgi:hypothetical protein
MNRMPHRSQNENKKPEKELKSCAPSGDEGPAVYIQTKEKDKQTVPRADKKKIPVGCQIFPHILSIAKHIRICVVERMSQQKTDGLY